MALATYPARVVLLVLVASCTPQDARTAADIIGALAPEVCVDQDSVRVCLSRCEREAERRGLLERP